ncbi:hypothetical protein CLOM_g22029, partial [Closterium sp. NIES-68]
LQALATAWGDYTFADRDCKALVGYLNDQRRLCDENGYIVSIGSWETPTDRFQISGIPEEISVLTHLTTIALQGVTFKGTLGPLAKLPNLQQLVMIYFPINAIIPGSFSQLSNLHYLNLRDTWIRGSIPAQLAQIPLIYFNVYNTNLTGAIPSFANCTDMEYLNLDAIGLTGVLPPCLGAAPLSDMGYGPGIKCPADGGSCEVQQTSDSVFCTACNSFCQTCIPVPEDQALPSTALPSEALPSEALPSEALPSEALPSEGLPSEALPSDAPASDALPSNTPPSEAPPSAASPSEALPPDSTILPPLPPPTPEPTNGTASNNSDTSPNPTTDTTKTTANNNTAITTIDNSSSNPTSVASSSSGLSTGAIVGIVVGVLLLVVGVVAVVFIVIQCNNRTKAVEVEYAAQDGYASYQPGVAAQV